MYMKLSEAQAGDVLTFYYHGHGRHAKSWRTVVVESVHYDGISALDKTFDNIVKNFKDDQADYISVITEPDYISVITEPVSKSGDKGNFFLEFFQSTDKWAVGVHVPSFGERANGTPIVKFINPSLEVLDTCGTCWGAKAQIMNRAVCFLDTVSVGDSINTDFYKVRDFIQHGK